MVEDYIKRSDALKFSVSIVGKLFSEEFDIKQEIQKIPSADVVEVKHGEWIKKPHWEPLPWDCEPSLSSTPDDYDEKTHSEKVMWWHCSCCDYSPDRGWKPHLNYCPHCGATMEEWMVSDVRVGSTNNDC